MQERMGRRLDTEKLGCKAVLKGLKKFRQYLYGIHFAMEVDAKTLVAQLNCTTSNLPEAMVTCWMQCSLQNRHPCRQTD